MKKVFIFLVMLSTFMLITITPTFASTGAYQIEVTNGMTSYTTSTNILVTANPEFDVLETVGLSTSGVYWITSTNRPKIEIELQNVNLRQYYKGVLVKLYDNDLANVFQYYFSFDMLGVDTNYSITDDLYLSMDYGSVDNIEMWIGTNQIINYPITIPTDNAYGLEVLLHVKSLDYASGYTNGQNDMFENGSNTYGYDESDSFDYKKGFEDLFENGSLFYNRLVENSADYLIGLRAGRNQNVGAGVTTFMVDFDKWIVPAILIVLILGGFLAVKKKSSGE